MPQDSKRIPARLAATSQRRFDGFGVRPGYVGRESPEGFVEDDSDRARGPTVSREVRTAAISSTVPHLLHRMRRPACCSSAWYVSPHMHLTVIIGVRQAAAARELGCGFGAANAGGSLHRHLRGAIVWPLGSFVHCCIFR